MRGQSIVSWIYVGPVEAYMLHELRRTNERKQLCLVQVNGPPSFRKKILQEATQRDYCHLQGPGLCYIEVFSNIIF
jgi:hypothetical protein